jgi:hypothetical protein
VNARRKTLGREGLRKLSNKLVYRDPRGVVQALFRWLHQKQSTKRDRRRVAKLNKIHSLLSHSGIDWLASWEAGDASEVETLRRLRAMAIRVLWASWFGHV